MPFFNQPDSFLGADIFPAPIVAERDPTTNDFAEVGRTWVNTDSDSVWVLTSISSGSANWNTSPASGVGTFTSATVNPGDLTVTAGDLDVTAGDATIGGDLTVTGDLSFSGDFDLTSSALIDLTSTLNSAPSILLHANGGTSEQIRLHADQGTSVNSIELDSDVGGITLVSGLASTDAINLSATAGGVDIDSALELNLTSTEDAAQAIYLRANGGTSETIDIHSDQGTGVDSINIHSDVGGVTVASGLASDDAINLNASAGGVDIDGALQVSMRSSENTADSVVIESTAGGIDILASSAAAGEDIDIVATGSSVNISSTEDTAQAIYLHADGGTSEGIYIHSDQGTGVESVNVESDVGGVTVTSGLASDDAINLEADNGGVDVDAALQLNLASSEAAADAIVIDASDAASGIDVDCGTGGMDFTATGGDFNVVSTNDAADAIYLHANGGTSETIRLHSDQGTGVASIQLDSDVGGVTLTSGLASDDAINLAASAGGIDLDAALQLSLVSTEAAADAIVIDASDAAGGIDVDAGTGGLNMNVAGGSISMVSTNDAADAIYLHANGGTSETIRLHSDQGTGADSVELESDVGGITLTATGLASDDAINLNAVAGGVDIDGALQVSMRSSENAADALVLESSAGGIDILASGAAAGEDIDIVATGSSVNVTSTEDDSQAIYLHANGGTSEGIDIHADQGTSASSINVHSDVGGVQLLSGLDAADAIYLHANAGTSEKIRLHADQGTSDDSVELLSDAGGIQLNSGVGNVSMVPQTASVAGTSLTNNGRVTVSTFTGQTTASSSSVSLTITNSDVTQGQGVFCTVSNTGSNDAHMTLDGVSTQTAGTLDIQLTNNGAAALNGDIVVTCWLIN